MYTGRLLFYDWNRRQDRNVLVLIASTMFGHYYKGIWEDGSASANKNEQSRIKAFCKGDTLAQVYAELKL